MVYSSLYNDIYIVNHIFLYINKWSIKSKFNTSVFNTSISGVAVTVANEEEFHAKATKKVKGSKSSIKLIKNASKVANICADVIGDICGVLSGAISALIAVKITNQFGWNFNLQFLLSALVSALTVGGKAIGKDLANKKSTQIVHTVGKIMSK